jgi:DegV family protein with EDD domain
VTQIKILTDSSAQLTEEEIKKYNITVVPLTVSIDGKTYQDGVDLTRAQFVKEMDASKELPKTSQPSIGLFSQKFKELTADGSSVLAIFLSVNLSGTINAARQAAEMVGADVEIVDSLYTDRCEGYQVLAAAQDAAAGKSMAEIKEHLADLQDRLHLKMMVVNLQNIIKGGRLGPLTGRVATLLNIRIALTMKKGELLIDRKGRGRKFTTKYVEEVLLYLRNHPNVSQLCISYVDSPDEIQKIADKIHEQEPNIKILTRITSPIIATHAGSGAFAIQFFTE